MKPLCESRWLAAAAFVTAVTVAVPAHAELSPEELAKLAQNLIGNVISVPFQNNTNLNTVRSRAHRMC
ncbi:MAG: hypothetical protein EOP82_11675 [Variovorax sp.]|nr:MAG: hypothetical protein EOP82_11675 [Variovorax sp.]